MAYVDTRCIPVFVTKPRETEEQRQQRIAATKANQEYRSYRAFRKRGGAVKDAQVANAFRELGIDYMALREKAFQQGPLRLEGVRVDRLSQSAVQFLVENFDVGQVEDRKSGKALLHFKTQKEKRKDNSQMNFLKEVVDKSEIHRKEVKQVYDAMVEVIHEQLKSERRVRLPEIGVVAVRYRAAKPKRKGMNPFTKQMTTFKAKPASNKLKINPAKQLKDFAAKLAVVAPKKK
jgi:nucleoid DNA-binding protein